MNPYEVLGITRGASPEEVQKAFRKKAMEHHPDRGGDVEVFKKVTEAYAMLKKGNVPAPQRAQQPHHANITIIYGPNGPIIRMTNPPRTGGDTFPWNGFF